MRNQLRRFGQRALSHEALRSLPIDATNCDDVTVDDLLRELRAIRPVPTLVAYEHAARGWYLAYTDGTSVDTIALAPDPSFNPERVWPIDEAAAATLGPLLARAFDDDDLIEAIALDGGVFIEGRTVIDENAWAEITKTVRTMPPVVVSHASDGFRRWMWREGRPSRVVHQPVPLASWQRLRERYALDDDAERVFLEML